MSNIDRRLKRLEALSNFRARRFIVVYEYREGDAERQLALVERATGRRVTRNDQVVAIRRFSNPNLPPPTVDQVPVTAILDTIGGAPGLALEPGKGP